MLQKAPSSMILTDFDAHRAPNRINAAMRGLCQWAVLDPGDKVLDMNCGNGALLEALGRKCECLLCGITPFVDRSREARALLPDADILFAIPEDIPWHDDAFDLVLSSQPLYEMEDVPQAMAEAFRVLKPGGQFLLATPWYPAPLRQLFNRFSPKSDDINEAYQSKQGVFDCLKAAGFDEISWHTPEFGMAIAVAWKKRDIISSGYSAC